MVKGRPGGIDGDQRGQNAFADGMLRDEPEGAVKATLVLAHGAGAPMDSPFMQEMALALCQRSVRVIRFEFPYMAGRRQGGTRRPPDPQVRLLEYWRQMYAEMRRQVTGPLAIGGKSMGGRMASLLADELGAAALVCLGYPFHPAGKPEKTRVEHLAALRTPTLIVQGERDALGNRDEVAQYLLASSIGLHWLPAADHDLKPLKRSGFTHEQHLQAAADAVANFIAKSATA